MPASGEGTLAQLLTGPVEQVAPRLLGAVLRHGDVAVRLTEVEAYGGGDDPASHAHRGPTARNRVMFGPPGVLYCYLSHGIHVCSNVSVADESREAAAVLLRAGEVVDGWPTAQARRPGTAERDLARGPGRLAAALGLELHHDGAGLSDGPLTLTPAADPARAVRDGPRVGVRRAAERPWRFWLEGAKTSAYRRHPRAEPEW